MELIKRRKIDNFNYACSHYNSPSLFDVNIEHIRIVNKYYASTGVLDYHARHIKGDNVKIYIVDTEIVNNLELPNIEVIDFTNTDPIEHEFHGNLIGALIACPGLDSYHSGFSAEGIASEAKVFLGAIDGRNDEGKTVLEYPAIIRAIYDAISKDVDIITLSFGSHDKHPDVDRAIQLAISKGILVFAAAGNDGNSTYMYPACCDGVIAVSSHDEDCNISGFATVNDKVAFFAPGSNLTLEDNDGKFYRVNGTSFSCPYAAALAALILCDKRKQVNDITFRYSRSDMISILTDENHLACNIKLLSEKTLSDNQQSINNPTQELNQGSLWDQMFNSPDNTNILSLSLMIFFLIIFILLYLKFCKTLLR